MSADTAAGCSGASSGLQTVAVHAACKAGRVAGAATPPIFQSATFLFDRPDDGVGYDDVRYTRCNNNPTQLAVGAHLAALEGAEAALPVASGMAAISTTLLSLLEPGAHVLAVDSRYGGTHDLLTSLLARYGVETTAVGADDDPETWADLLRPGGATRVFYVEAITNPLARVMDLRAVAAFAKRHGLTSIIDGELMQCFFLLQRAGLAAQMPSPPHHHPSSHPSTHPHRPPVQTATFATPVNLRPLELGFDAVVHSATKFLNGHSDVIAGVVAGRRALVERIRATANLLGCSLDPHAAFLLSRGLRTLGLRVARQNANALALARLLESHAAVARVHYPGLESSPYHERARALFAGGGFGGVLSFELVGGVEAAEAVMRRLRLALVAPSLGGVETLVTRPATTSHAGMSAAERAAAGISDGLVRVAVGVEDTADLLDDFGAALACLGDGGGDGDAGSGGNTAAAE